MINDTEMSSKIIHPVSYHRIKKLNSENRNYVVKLLPF